MAAQSLLGARRSFLPRRQVLRVAPPSSFGPIVLQRGIVHGGGAFYERVPLDWNPGEFEQVRAGALVSEYPPIGAFQVQRSPVLAFTPSPPFLRVGELDVRTLRPNIQ
jgi:hypothetical protein